MGKGRREKGKKGKREEEHNTAPAYEEQVENAPTEEPKETQNDEVHMLPVR